MLYIRQKFQILKTKYPIRLIVGSFILFIIVGTIFLILPISSRDSLQTDFISAFFTSVSATCVTGLVVFDTWTHWSFFGQLILLILMQVGALSVISIMMGFILVLRKEMGLRDMAFLQAYTSGNIMNMPLLVKTILFVTVISEIIGSLILMIRFIPKFGVYGIWISIFMSVSSYCNAGFDLMGIEEADVSLKNYVDDPLVSITVSLLVILGGISFIVISDIYLYIIRKYKEHQSNIHLEFNSKIVIVATVFLLIISTIVITFLEYNNTLVSKSFFQKINAAFFEASTIRSAGFDNLGFGDQINLTKVFVTIMMFIGTAPCSTGGGIKVTTFAVMLYTIISVFKGKKEILIHHHKINKMLVYRALTICVLSIISIMLTFFLISIIEKRSDISTTDLLFETVSSFSTGVSVGIVPQLSKISQIILTFLMFAGRIGPFSLVLALYVKNNNKKEVILPEVNVLL